MSKTAFYFKTQEEFHRVFLFVDELNKNARKRLKIRGLIIAAKSRYVGDLSRIHFLGTARSK